MSPDKDNEFISSAFDAFQLTLLAFVAVLNIIVDLDRPQQALLTVSQTALSDLLGQMTTTVP